MDSLTSVELAGMIERETSVRLPFSMLSDRVTVSQIAAYVNDRLRSDRREKSFGPTNLTERGYAAATIPAPCRLTGGHKLSEAMVELLFLFRSPRYPKIDDEADREVKARIERVLFSDEIPYPRDIALICLADACGILEMVFDESELEKIASRMELLRKMDLIAREMGGMIAEVKRSPSTAWEMPVAPSSVSARALETSRQVACRASDSQKTLAKSSRGAPSLAGTRRIFVLCCAAGTPRMTPLSRIDSSRASHSFSAGYRAASSRKLSCANSSSTESRTATTNVDWASSEKTPNSPTVPPCEISSTIFASRPSSADNI